MMVNFEMAMVWDSLRVTIRWNEDDVGNFLLARI